MKLLLLFILFIPILVFSQEKENRLYDGYVFYKDSVVENVQILNINSNQSPYTTNRGWFQLNLNEGDTLLISHVAYKSFTKKIKMDALQADSLVIHMPEEINELDEVSIYHSPDINAVSLGIIKKEPKKLTVNERRLRTAGDFKLIHLLSLLGGSLQVDPIINKISGRTKRLKKYIKFDEERAEYFYLKEEFSSAISSNLTIEEQEVNRYIYYLIDHPTIQDLIKAKNTLKLEFYIYEFFPKYKEDYQDL